MRQGDRYYPVFKTKRFLMKRICPKAVHRLLPGWITANRLPGVPGKVHTLDLMLARTSQSGATHYLSVGKSAIENCRESLAAANRRFSDIRTCLDLPCGHGRVLRWLCQEIDPKGVTACEIDHDAVDFCRREFGVKGVYSSHDLEKVVFPDEYDLIWVGSLFTHLDPNHCGALARRLGGAMRKGGVLVFSTHGEGCFTKPGLAMYGKKFPLMAQQMADEFRRNGYCYAPYGDQGYYGIAIHSQDYIRTLVDKETLGTLKLVHFKERGWMNHHDIWSFQKN